MLKWFSGLFVMDFGTCEDTELLLVCHPTNSNYFQTQLILSNVPNVQFYILVFKCVSILIVSVL